MIPQNRVKATRLEKGYSGLELSRQTKIAPSTLHNIENMKTPVYPGWRRRIAAALETPAEKLFPEVEKNDSARK